MEAVEKSISFKLRGIKGETHIRYEVNEDPAAWGFDHLGLDMDPNIARGFPVIEGRVKYPAKGYLGALGWIQVVDYVVRNGSSEEKFTVAPDVPPQARDANIPYGAYGIEPRLFDAPAIPEKNVDWTARAFLTYTPDLLITPVVEPLCGCKWGYTVKDGVVMPKPLEPVAVEDWLHARERLHAALPMWTFRGDEWQAPGFDS